MPPKRTRNNVDDNDNDEESDIKTIRIVSPNSEKGVRFMCELCSSILKSAASLDRHKKSKHGSDDKYICRHACIYCEGFRGFSTKRGKIVPNTSGRWYQREDRSYNSCLKHHLDWQAGTYKDRHLV